MSDSVTLNYLPSGAPPPPADQIPPGQVLVHNHIRPAPRQGVRGFRFWLQRPEQAPAVTPCECGWAPEAGVHFQVLRP